MTIKVTISNDDAVRHMEVIEVNFDKDAGTRHEGAPALLRAGEHRTFYIHQLRDLRVREAHADLQMRPVSEVAHI